MHATHRLAFVALLSLTITGFNSCAHSDEHRRSETYGEASGTNRKTVSPAVLRQPVDVTLRDGEIAMPTSLVDGATTFRITNSGGKEHSFAIEGPDLSKRLDRSLRPGERVTLEADLNPGDYRVWCPLGNHADQGMRQQVHVTLRATR